MSEIKITDVNWVMPNSPYAPTKQIAWMYGHGLTKCDCGKDLLLSQNTYGGHHIGECSCGITLKYKNGKFITTKNKPTAWP